VKSSGPRFQVHGTRGSFIKYGTDSQEQDLRLGKGPGFEHWGKDREDLYGDLTIQAGELQVKGKVETIPGSYESFYKGLYHAILDHKPTPVEAIDAMHTIKVIEAVKLSSKEKRTVSFK
jgi:scyllo-inositol 2-dehydrogenase (NADP+)